MNYIILSPIVLSFLLGVFIRKATFKSEKALCDAAVVSSFIMALSAVGTLLFCFGEELTIFRLSETFKFGFRVDGLGAVFVALVSFLWPLATIYATKYMTHEGDMTRFFAYYTYTYGVVVGLAFSQNMLTVYLFYECLTFITLPLVIHNNRSKDIYAGGTYVVYSVFGAAISFVGMIIFLGYTNTLEFSAVPVMDMLPHNNLLIAYLLMFIGFSVKAGMVPFHGWLISAGVAPTTVTALLHAVAVVKSGAFVVLRLTYNLYDIDYIRGSWAQYVAMALCIISILIGSSMAMKNKYIKRRFAYSTVSQLSYILLAAVAMSPVGLLAAVVHMIFHALIKIVIFYTAGNVIFTGEAYYVRDIEGYGKKMPITFVTFVISAIALVGIPPFGGFVSKLSITQSVITVGGAMGFLAVSALMISALFTAMYLFQIASLAFIPHDGFDMSSLEKVSEAPSQMVVPMAVITAVMALLSVFSADLIRLLEFLLGVG